MLGFTCFNRHYSTETLGMDYIFCSLIGFKGFWGSNKLDLLLSSSDLLVEYLYLRKMVMADDAVDSMAALLSISSSMIFYNSLIHSSLF